MMRTSDDGWSVDACRVASSLLARCGCYAGRCLRRRIDMTVVRRRNRHGLDWHARLQLGLALHHDAIAGVEPAVDHPLVLDTRFRLDRPMLGLAIRRNHVHGLLALHLLYRLLRNADRVGVLELRDDHANEEPWTQHPIWVGDGDSRLQRSRLLVDRRVDEVELARIRI